MLPHLKNGAVVELVIDWRSLHLLLQAAEPLLGPLINLAVWVKDRRGQGSFLRSQHELILIFKAGKGRFRNNVDLGRHGRDRSNVWSYPSARTASTGSDEGDMLKYHPTPKSVRMLADAISDCTRRGDIILDAFLGSGTTLIAVEKVGRTCHAVELDPLYVDLAIRRWQAWTGEAAVHQASGRTFDHKGRGTADAVPRGRPNVMTKRRVPRDPNAPKKQASAGQTSGYCLPPKAGQIQPGEVRNRWGPKGKPKPEPIDPFEFAASQPTKITLNGKQIEVTAELAVHLSNVQAALTVDHRARKNMLEERRSRRRAAPPKHADEEKQDPRTLEEQKALSGRLVTLLELGSEGKKMSLFTNTSSGLRYVPYLAAALAEYRQKHGVVDEVDDPQAETPSEDTGA